MSNPHVYTFFHTPRTSYPAKTAREALEILDLQQIDNPDERQEWTPAYRERVEEIIDMVIRLSGGKC